MNFSAETWVLVLSALLGRMTVIFISLLIWRQQTFSRVFMKKIILLSVGSPLRSALWVRKLNQATKTPLEPEFACWDSANSGFIHFSSLLDLESLSDVIQIWVASVQCSCWNLFSQLCDGTGCDHILSAMWYTRIQIRSFFSSEMVGCFSLINNLSKLLTHGFVEILNISMRCV